MQQAVIAGYDCTPFHFARNGAPAQVRPYDLTAAAIRALIQRVGVDPATLDDLILGGSFQEGARITGKAAQILRREGKRFALSTRCTGGGQGIATILEAA